jgi:hypothetical protein
MLKIHVEYERDTSSAKFKDIFRQLPSSLLGVSVAIKRALVDKSGMIRTRGRTIDHKTAAEHGTLCTIPPRKSNTQRTINNLDQHNRQPDRN